MSAGSNPNLTAIVGSVQQNSAMAAYSRHVSKLSPDIKSLGDRGLEGTFAAKESHDSTSISREGMAALETARKMDDETVVRDEGSAAQMLALTTDEIKGQAERAVSLHANQTAEQVLELYGQ